MKCLHQYPTNPFTALADDKATLASASPLSRSLSPMAAVRRSLGVFLPASNHLLVSLLQCSHFIFLFLYRSNSINFFFLSEIAVLS
jgi:hypothetical protein